MEEIIKIKDKLNYLWTVKIYADEDDTQLVSNYFVFLTYPPKDSNEGSIGFAGYSINKKTGIARLEDIEIEPKYRDIGIGSELLAEVEKSAVKNGVSYIYGDIVELDEGEYSKNEHFYKKNRWKWLLYKRDDPRHNDRVLGIVEKKYGNFSD